MPVRKLFDRLPTPYGPVTFLPGSDGIAEQIEWFGKRFDRADF